MTDSSSPRGRGKPKASEIQAIPLGYAPVPPEMIAYRKSDGSRLSTLAVFTWCALAMHRSIETGQAFPSNKTLSGILGTDQRSVKRALAELVEAGFLLRSEQERDSETGRYSLTIYTIAVEGQPVMVGLKKTREGTGGQSRHPDRGASSLSPGGIVGNGKEESRKEDLTPTGEAEASAGTFCQYLREELDGADIPLLRGRLDRYGSDFKKHLDKGISADVLYKCADRIVERWTGDEHTKLTVEKALEDVVNGKPPKHVQTNGASTGTSREVIAYIFENARNPELRRYEPILRRWDFTSPEPPPFSIEKQLGGTDNERWANLNALQTLARRARRSPEAVA